LRRFAAIHKIGGAISLLPVLLGVLGTGGKKEGIGGGGGKGGENTVPWFPSERRLHELFLPQIKRERGRGGGEKKERTTQSAHSSPGKRHLLFSRLLCGSIGRKRGKSRWCRTWPRNFSSCLFRKWDGGEGGEEKEERKRCTVFIHKSSLLFLAENKEKKKKEEKEKDGIVYPATGHHNPELLAQNEKGREGRR